jgi:hypothetical protein
VQVEAGKGGQKISYPDAQSEPRRAVTVLANAAETAVDPCHHRSMDLQNEVSAMKRRALLRGLLVGLPASAGVAAGAALRSRDYVKGVSEPSLTALKARIDALKTQLEQRDARNKTLIKLAIGLAALSLGLDASALL